MSPAPSIEGWGRGRRCGVRLCAFLVAALVLAVDALTKSAAVDILSHDRSINILPGIFRLTLVFNKGAAFGLFKDRTLFFIGLSIIVSTIIIFYIFYKKDLSMASSFSLGLILAGTSGNLLDRMRFGYVIDFFDFRVWPVFNVADLSITIGVVSLVYRMLIQNRKERLRKIREG